MVDDCQTQQLTNICFDRDHLEYAFKMQQLINTIDKTKLIALFGSLSPNEAAKNLELYGYLITDAQQNDLGLIFLGLFVPWQYLRSKFLGCTKLIYLDRC